MVEVIGVVGAGFMGSGIAESAARAGVGVHLLRATRTTQLERSDQRIADSVRRAVSRGKSTEDDATALRRRIHFTTSLEDLGPVPGRRSRRSSRTRRRRARCSSPLDAALPDARFLASNTSSIPIAELAARTSRPERVLGLHFFSPVPVMKLVEVVVALDTAERDGRGARGVRRRLGKHPIRTKDRAGFIVNMLLIPYLMAARPDVRGGLRQPRGHRRGDEARRGHPMGPLKLCDFIGLDVLYAVCDSLYEEFKRDEYAPPPLMKRMIVAGQPGRKTGRGFYDYVRG